MGSMRYRDILKDGRYDGCGNHSCYFSNITGQGTNGPCGCLNKKSFMRVQFQLALNRVDQLEKLLTDNGISWDYLDSRGGNMGINTRRDYYVDID